MASQPEHLFAQIYLSPGYSSYAHLDVRLGAAQNYAHLATHLI